MHRFAALCFLLFTIFQTTTAQSPARTVRGEVLDVVTHEPLVGATVRITNLGRDHLVLTEGDGSFELPEVPLGRHRFEATYVGYGTKILPGVLIEGGQTDLLQIWMTPSSEDLTEFVVTGTAGELNALTPLGLETFSIEETERFAGSFYDPARLVTNFAGVINTNDQANGISVRGNNPDANGWRLEGLEIVNPNHTPNAGTFNDLTTFQAGGVLALSGQMLDNSALLKGAYPASYGNALGGILDLYLKRADPNRDEVVLQIGLIGLDYATSGPIGDNGITFSSNVRYSFTGILGALGVDFGGERISFGDGAFNLYVPTVGAGDFTLFAVVGSSSNVFETERDISLWEENKDRFDIDYEYGFAVLGATHEIRVGSKSFLRTASAFSVGRSERIAERFNMQLQVEETNFSSTRQDLFSFRTDYRNQLARGTELSVGIMANYYDDEFPIGSVADNSFQAWLFAPYASLRHEISDRLTADVGFRYAAYTLGNGSTSPEPRAALSYRIGERGRLAAAAGLHSQLLNSYITLSPPGAVVRGDNRDLPLRRAAHYSLGYRHFLADDQTVEVEGFYQNLFDVPVVGFDDVPLSAINGTGGFSPPTLVSTGRGTNYGVELSYRRFLTDSWYWLANATLFESTYEDFAGTSYDSRWAANYVGNLTLGREWTWTKREDRGRTFGLNARAVVRGGYRDLRVDEFASQLRQRTIYESFLLEEELPDYYRIDLRLYQRWERNGRTSMLSLDLQNVTNRENAAFIEFDVIQQAVVTRRQLGLIPVLNYRLELTRDARREGRSRWGF